MKESGEPRSRHPRREQYEADPRSKALRDVCIEIIKKEDALLNDPNVDRLEATGRIEALIGKLITLGITPNMHVGDEPHTFEGPVKVAEFVAGQLYGALNTGSTFTSREKIRPLMGEFSEKRMATNDNSSAYLMTQDAADKPEALIQFQVDQNIVNIAASMLDAEDEFIR